MSQPIDFQKALHGLEEAIEAFGDLSQPQTRALSQHLQTLLRLHEKLKDLAIRHELSE